MYKYLFLILFLPVITQALTIPEIIATTALKYGIDPKLALYISYKESGWDPSAIGDHGNSIGLVQISKIYHPEVTRKQALDPVFSAEFLASELSKEKCHEWSTCPL